jgi:hypothetical protein
MGSMWPEPDADRSLSYRLESYLTITIIVFLDIINRPVFYLKRNVSETDLSFFFR